MAWRHFLNRSLEQIRDETARVLRASPVDPNYSSKVMPLVSIRKEGDLRNWAIGSDSDIGGLSRATLETYPEDSPDAGKGRFFGSLSSKVLPQMKLAGSKVDRSGYAGIRSKSRPTIFGIQTWDTSTYTFLKVRVKPSPDEGMRYFVNIQTDGPVQSDLFQHRLWLGEPGKWQDVLVPFSDFTLTNTGALSETQIEMFREKVRTVGISVLGPGEGPFELGIESFECVNVEDKESDLLLDDSRKKTLAAQQIAYVMAKERQ